MQLNHTKMQRTAFDECAQYVDEEVNALCACANTLNAPKQNQTMFFHATDLTLSCAGKRNDSKQAVSTGA